MVRSKPGSDRESESKGNNNSGKPVKDVRTQVQEQRHQWEANKIRAVSLRGKTNNLGWEISTGPWYSG